MENILKVIQGKDELVYTLEEVAKLNETVEKVKMFFPRNKDDERAQNTLFKNIEKLQKAIIEYSETIEFTMLTGQQLSKNKLENLKKKYQTIVNLDKQVVEEHYRLELKYQ